MNFKKIVIMLLLLSGSVSAQIPDGFVDIQEAIPSIVLDMRYATSHNFIGRPVDGYRAPKCYLTKEAASALAAVQEELLKYALSLKVYDGFRPQRAVDHFVRWAKDLHDNKTKMEFYPTILKSNLFRDGFISSRSGHSRGSTVDVTIVPLPLPEQESYVDGQPLCECTLSADKRFGDNSLDMGTGFDCFHENSWTGSQHISAEARAHRLLLVTLMKKHGFRNYRKEWWHFTLETEPYPDTYFNFVIE